MITSSGLSARSSGVKLVSKLTAQSTGDMSTGKILEAEYRDESAVARNESFASCNNSAVVETSDKARIMC